MRKEAVVVVVQRSVLIPIGIFVAFLFASPALAGPVLTSETAPQLEQAFAHDAAGLVLDDAQIGADRIAMRVCRPDKRCLALTLTHPGPPCAGEATPAFCVEFAAQRQAFAPDDAALLQVLARVPVSVWHAPEAAVVTQEPPHSPWPDRRPLLQLGLMAVLFVLLLLASRGPLGRLVALVVIAAGLVAWHRLPSEGVHDWLAHREFAALGWEAIWWLVPLTLGFGVGLLALRWLKLRWPLLLIPAALALVPIVWRPLVFGDALAMAVVGVLVALWQSDLAPHRARRWLLAGLMLGLSLALLEGVLHGGREPAIVEDSRQELLQTPPMHAQQAETLQELRKPAAADSTLSGWAEALFVAPAQFRALRAQPPQGPWILHLGDSLLFGTGIAAADAVPAQLTPLLPGYAEVNAGLPGSTVDLQFALLDRLLRAWPVPALVVLHVYPGNDLTGLDVPLDFCGGLPVLAQLPADVSLTCQTWRPETLEQRLLHTPLPLPLQRAARWSWLARRLVAVHATAQTPKAPLQMADASRRYQQIVAKMQAILRDRHIPLVAAFMPVRPGSQQDEGAAARALIEVFAALHVTLLDSQAIFDKRSQAGEERQLFLGDNDVHLTEQGAKVYATWLAPFLTTALTPH
jgi:lysophospholipase L1-like esterase